jgi:SpoVK/Ycf46/Vps4 family AAA+-type ATPase
MSRPGGVFDAQIPLPSKALTEKSRTLLGFEENYATVRDLLRLMLNAGHLPEWNREYHQGKLDLAALVQDQYPFVVFHGDVGTGKTATAEAIANRIVAEARVEESVLYKLSNRVRGSGMVGELGSLVSQAFQDVIKTAGKHRRAILVIDEGDSLAASRTQEHSHHEDKVGVNTLIQHIDDLRQYQGRIIAILCTNRLSVLDPALRRRAAVALEFKRPDQARRQELFSRDLAGIRPTQADIIRLVAATGERAGQPGWTYSDIRTRLYPAALAKVFPDRPLTVETLLQVAASMAPSPVMADK